VQDQGRRISPLSAVPGAVPVVVFLLAVSLVLGVLALLPASVPVAGTPVAGAQSGAITGVDVASWQHGGGQPINWASVRNAGHRFAFVKATEGASTPGGGRYTNPWFAQDWVGAGAAGLYRGAYHFGQPTGDPVDAVLDARHFVAATGVMNGALDLPPVLDIEVANGLSKAQMVAWISAWLTETQRLTGRQPIIYTGPYFWNTNVGSTAFTGYRLWIASYTSAPGPGPLPGGWPTWAFWQWTSTGTVPGITGNTDINRFCCDLSTLAGLTSGGGAQVAGNPFGTVDGGRRVPDAIEVTGWAIDPDTTGTVSVHAYVDGRFGGSYLANALRTDVGAAYPQYGNNHGIAIRVPATSSTQQVCLYAINIASGNANPLLGCVRPPGNPIGNLEGAAARAAGQVTLTGWATDPDTTNPIDVDVYVDGRWGGTYRANVARPDVVRVFPGAGPNTGFSAVVAASPGLREVCVYAINVGAGTANPRLGCRVVGVPGNAPIGNLESASGGLASVSVSGWGFDIDATAPLEVAITVDGVPAGTVTTGGARPDVTRLFGAASAPGFTARIPVPVIGTGTRTVCATLRNVGAGSNTPLACRRVVMPADPGGNLESVSVVGNRLRVTGWAADPDTAGAVEVHVYVDGRWGGALTADALRPDIGLAFPVLGPRHGFDTVLARVTQGTHRACAYAINVGAGTANPLLGCRTFVADYSPIGNFEAATRTIVDPTRVLVNGWFIDPDADAPARVRIRVGGTTVFEGATNAPRPDVAAVYPWSTGPQGLAVEVPAAAGAQVCVTALNQLGGSDVNFGCRTVP
jgi:GH25 family lysozyme M1 (1,4-beta-N-acetylmuramidase)